MEKFLLREDLRQSSGRLVVFGEKSERIPVYIGTSIGPEGAVICRERKMARTLRPIRSIYQVIDAKYQVALNRELSARIRNVPAAIQQES